MYALLLLLNITIIFIYDSFTIFIGIINNCHYHYLEFYIVPPLSKKQKDRTTYNLKIVCLTMLK